MYQEQLALAIVVAGGITYENVAESTTKNK